MDITKRFNRILQMFFLLQSKSVVTSEELKSRFEISQRTIFRDLRALELAGVPILNEAGTGYSIIEGFRLQPSRFSQEETLSLMIAEKIMQKHETEFVKRHFEAAMIKIKSSFLMHQKNDLQHLEDKFYFDNQFSANEYLPNVIDVLLNSTLKGKIASISYLKRNDTTTTSRQVEPVGIFHEKGFWYLIAWCHLRKDYRNFRLDRIKKVYLLDDKFTLKHPPVNKLRGTGACENITQIIIRVDKKHAHFLFWERQKFGFKEEKIIDDDVMMDFDCTFHPSSFVRWFLTFADVAEIIAPAYLQTELTGILTTALEKMNKKIAV